MEQGAFQLGGDKSMYECASGLLRNRMGGARGALSGESRMPNGVRVAFLGLQNTCEKGLQRGERSHATLTGRPLVLHRKWDFDGTFKDIMVSMSKCRQFYLSVFKFVGSIGMINPIVMGRI